MKRSLSAVKRILIAAAVMMLAVSCAMAQDAVVDNGQDPSSMLNVRTAPDKGAAALGKFFSGTPVKIAADAGGGWSQITIGSSGGVISGYAMTQYLGTGSRVDARRSATVVSPYGTQSVVLRDKASNSYHPVAMLMVGDHVLVIGEMGEFCYVQTDSGCVGCLLESELK